MTANPVFRSLQQEQKVEHTPAGLRVKGKAIVRSVDRISGFVLRYGLVLVVLWIGCLKFTAYESKGVFNHASHSPLLAWAYNIRPVSDQGCCVVGSSYLDPRRFSETRRCWERNGVKSKHLTFHRKIRAATHRRVQREFVWINLGRRAKESKKEQRSEIRSQKSEPKCAVD